MNATRVPSLHQIPIGARISRLRRRRGWSQQVLADRIGKSKSWVDKIESGARPADRLSALRNAAAALDVTLATLILDDEPGTAAPPAWRHVECGHLNPANPPPVCAGCGRWEGNWHQAQVTR